MYENLVYATPGPDRVPAPRASSRTRASGSGPATSSAPTRPRTRRDDPARQGLRHPPRLRPHARRHDVRRRLRGRRGPPVLHGRAAQRRAAAPLSASPAAPRAIARWTRTSGRRRPTTSPTSSASTTTSTSSTAPRAPGPAATSRDYVAGVQAYIAEARLNPLKMPASTPRIGRPAGPGDWNVRDVIATATADRRHLRQGRRLRSSTRRWRCRHPRSAGSAPRGATPPGADFRSADDPEAPVTVLKKKLPLPAAAEEGREGQPGDARPGVGGQETKFEVGSAPAARRRRAAAPARSATLLAIPVASSPTRCWCPDASRPPAGRWPCSAPRPATSTRRS